MVVGNSLLINAVRSELDIATNLFLSLAGLFLCILWGISKHTLSTAVHSSWD
jgi:hypothetical protein